MTKETLLNKLEGIRIAIRVRIGANLIDKGVESQFINSDKVLKVKDKQQFNLDGGRWLVEISVRNLIDNKGHSYDHSVLSLEQICEVVDNI